MKTDKTYIDLIPDIAQRDIITLRRKDASYGGSWMKRGGVGAYMMACRKFDRLEEQVRRHGWDIFKAALEDGREDGILDDIADLRAYLFLIEAQIRVLASDKAPKRSYKASKPKNRSFAPKQAPESL